MKLTLSLDQLAAGTQGAGGAAPVVPELAALFAALLSGKSAVGADEPSSAEAPQSAVKDDDIAPVPSEPGDDSIASVGAILPPPGMILPVLPRALPMPAAQAVTADAPPPLGQAGTIAQSMRAAPAHPAASRGEITDTSSPLPPGLEWLRAIAATPPTGPQPAAGAMAVATPPGGPSLASPKLAPDYGRAEAAITSSSRLASLRAGGQSGAEPAGPASPAVAAAAEAVVREPPGTDKPRATLRAPAPPSILADQPAVAPLQQAMLAGSAPAAPSIETQSAFHAPRVDLARQIDRAVEALGAAPGDGVERAARLTIAHERLGPMALHLAREDDGAIGLDARAMPQELRQILTDGFAVAERRVAAPAQSGAAPALHSGDLGDHTQGRGSNGEPRSSLDERSNNGREHAARQDRSPGERQSPRRQPPGHGVFA